MLPGYDKYLQVLPVILDLVLAGLALFLALQLQLGGSPQAIYAEHFEQALWPVLFLNLAAFLILGVYRRQGHLFARRDYAALLGAVLTSLLAVMSCGFFFGLLLPQRVLIFFAVLLFLFTASLRYLLSRVI